MKADEGTISEAMQRTGVVLTVHTTTTKGGGGGGGGLCGLLRI